MPIISAEIPTIPEIVNVKAPDTFYVKKTFTIKGTLSDNNQAVANAIVTLQRSADGVTYGNVKTATTDAAGGYSFENLRVTAAGSYCYRTVYNRTYLSNMLTVEKITPWSKWHTGAVIVCLAVLVGLPVILAAAAAAGFGISLAEMYAIWVVIFFDVVIVMVVAGHGLTGRKSGLLIDERNRMSTSRLQIIIWTLVIIPALLAFIYINIGHGQTPDAALNIAIPPELWALLGISGGAAIGGPVANNVTNRNKDPDPNAEKRAKTLPGALDHEGVLDVNIGADAALFGDVFQGDEIGNRDRLDISKVQMLLISVGLALGYGAAIAIQLAHATPASLPLASFPAVDPNLATLLLVSQGTYVGYKAAPHTKGNSTATT